MTSICISASFLIAHNPFGCMYCGLKHFNLPFLTFHVAGKVCSFHYSKNLLLSTLLTLAGSWFLLFKGIFPPLANYFTIIQTPLWKLPAFVEGVEILDLCPGMGARAEIHPDHYFHFKDSSRYSKIQFFSKLVLSEIIEKL